MIRKSMPSGHDPMGGYRFSLATKREAFARRSCSNEKIERDDDSKKSHPALAFSVSLSQITPGALARFLGNASAQKSPGQCRGLSIRSKSRSVRRGDRA